MSQLLRQARQRVDKVLKLIQVLKSHEFPHEDSRKTLAFVEGQFGELQDTLQHLNDSLNDPHTIRANCRSALEAVFAYLPVNRLPRLISDRRPKLTRGTGLFSSSDLFLQRQSRN